MNENSPLVRKKKKNRPQMIKGTRKKEAEAIQPYSLQFYLFLFSITGIFDLCDYNV